MQFKPVYTRLIWRFNCLFVKWFVCAQLIPRKVYYKRNKSKNLLGKISSKICTLIQIF
jgi:hypothetical protein